VTEAEESRSQQQNPARDLQEFLHELLHYPHGHFNMLAFFSNRYDIEPPDQLVVLTMMAPDLQLPARAMRATESALGHRAEKYLQWKDNVLTCFSRINLETNVDNVRSLIPGDTMTHLDYCVSRLDELDPDDDLQALIEMIDDFRDKAKSLNLDKSIVKSIHENLQELEDVAWDHFYRLDTDEGVIGKIAFNLTELRRRSSSQKLGRFVHGCWQVLWRLYLYRKAGQELLPDAEKWVKGLLPGDEN